MPDLRTDLEELRDSWLKLAECIGFHEAARLTSRMDAASLTTR